MKKSKTYRGQVSSTVLQTVLLQLPTIYEVFLNDFLAELDARPTTKATYRRSLLQFFLFLEDSDTTLETCQKSTLVAYKAHLLQQVENQRFSLLTADNYLNAVKRFFSWIFENDRLPHLSKNIAAELSINADYEGFKKEALSIDQVQLLLQQFALAIQNPADDNRARLVALRDYACAFLLVSSGIRTITLTRINVGDISLLHGKPVIFVQRKGRIAKDDFIILEATPYHAIFEYLKARFQVESLEKLNPEQQQTPLFAGHSNRNEGERLTPDRIRQIIKKKLRLIGLDAKVFSTHSLRHTYGTLQLQLTGDIFQVAENLGHKDLKSTKRYTAKERQRQRIDNYTQITHLFKKD